jgi:succinoglycan biosynthesis protein ExoA
MTPRVSVLLPCRNEARHIAECLESILSQETPEGGFELLVIDGNSDDETLRILHDFAAKDARVRVLSNPQKFVSHALNLGIRAARGEIIVRMDAHSIYAPDYLRMCVDALERTNATNVGGPARTMAKTYIEGVIAAAYHSPFAVGGARFHDTSFEGYVDTVPYGCWRRAAFEKFGYFLSETRTTSTTFALREAAARSGRRPAS